MLLRHRWNVILHYAFPSLPSGGWNLALVLVGEQARQYRLPTEAGWEGAGRAINGIKEHWISRLVTISICRGRGRQLTKPRGSARSPQQAQTKMKSLVKVVSTVSLLTGALTFALPSLHALTVTPISQGDLPGGEVISVVQFTIDPGESIPWHFHTGPGWGTIVTGTLTEDEGCGTSLNTIDAGSSFSETPGRVHRVFNLGSGPVVLTWVEIYPGCDPNGGTAFVTGPRCEGQSGRSHLEKIPDCE